MEQKNKALNDVARVSDVAKDETEITCVWKSCRRFELRPTKTSFYKKNLL